MSARVHLARVLAVTTITAAACSSGSDAADRESTDTAVEVFDSTVVHDIEVDFDQGDYDAMVATYADSGEKEWIEATATIDGVTYEQVGMRLKGNSSLMGLGGGRPGGGEPTTESTEDTTTAADDTTTTTRAETTTTTAGGEPGRGGGGFGPGGSASADAPESLPWLIRLDEYVDGQDHQGYEDIVIRSNGSETSLNEAVALDLLEQVGLASQQAASTSFSVNGDDAVLRLAIEHPDDDAWQEANFDGQGALYKAESTGDWSYKGDDPADYEEVWDQEGGSDVTDLTPLTDFLQFINESDDATFAAELPEHLDVESFATYLAAMEVLGNFDDIDGPGNNAYLWYDVGAEQFTLVPWDMNLALGSGFGGGEGSRPGGPQPPADGQMPEGVEPPDGFEPPADGEAPEGFQPPEGMPEGGGGFGRSNILVERFHANAEFEDLYQEKLTDLRASLYEGGVAAEVLALWVDTLTEEATDLVSEETITEEAEAIAGQFTAE